MFDLIKIHEWIKNPKRDFREGLALYRKYKTNSKLDDFFSMKENNPDNTAVQVLLQKMIAIEAKLRANPAFLEKKLVEAQVKRPPLGTKETPKSKPLPTQQNKFVDKAEKVLSSSPAITKIDSSKLPKHLGKGYERIQEIVPMLGALHAKLKASSRPDESKNLCDSIIALDNEKRKLWGDIDDFNGKSNEDKLKMLNPNFDKIEKLTRQLRITKDSLTRKNKEIEEKKRNPKKHHLVNKAIAKKKEYEGKIQQLEEEIGKLSGNFAEA